MGRHLGRSRLGSMGAIRMKSAMFTEALPAREFILAGRAFITLRSQRTGDHFTYRVIKPERGDCWFVNHLAGPDNETSYIYTGMIGANREFVLTRKSKITEGSTVFRAFTWMWRHLIAGTIAPELEIWHEGKCGRCGRKLTVPESIERGIGPDCAEMMWVDRSKRRIMQRAMNAS